MPSARPQFNLRAAARQAMIDHGFRPDFGPEAEAEAEVAALVPAANAGPLPGVRDLRDRPWSSIDEVESRDLDQVEVAEPLPGGDTRVLVAIADVDSLVPAGSAIDDHAGWNTTSVYTGAAIFPMLPEALSTDLTSLNEGVDRPAIVIDQVVAADGSSRAHDVYRALVHNHTKLDYDAVGAWLEGRGPAPAKVDASPELAAQLRRQDSAAQALRTVRYERGALPLETMEARAVMEGETVTGLVVKAKNRARQLIEDFMVAANVAMAAFLAQHGSSWIGRVVRTPKRWERIAALARELGDPLPDEPSASALAGFLERQRARDPLRYPDLSLSVVKLLGSGEYVLDRPGDTSAASGAGFTSPGSAKRTRSVSGGGFTSPPRKTRAGGLGGATQHPPAQHEGHFGLAVDDYTHSTAPNRRYGDLVTQRLLKAVLAKRPPAYDDAALAAIASRCTEREDEANKVERQVRKQAAALLLARRIGARFDAIVTGANAKGTWVRLLRPPVEGRVMRGEEGLDVGDRVRVKLLSTDPVRGFIDFARD